MLNLKKILLATNHLHTLGGTETFTFALAEQLVELGYTVDLFSFNYGEASERIKHKVKIINNLDELADFYHIAIVSHNTCIEKIPFNAYITAQICHGTTAELEQPSPLADIYISISEEVHTHLVSLGYASKVIRNGIDCRRFFPENPVNDRLTKVLSLCQSAEANTKLKKACETLNINFSYLNKHTNSVWETEKYINEADLVVSLGRGAYEAMASGRSVLVYDERVYTKGGDGILTRQNINELIRYNLSGRFTKKQYTVSDLISELEKYDKNQGSFNRAYALEHLNIYHNTKQIIKYCTKNIPVNFLFRKAYSFDSIYNGKFIHGASSKTTWEVNRGIKTLITSPEHMTSRMQALYQTSEWRYEVVSEDVINNIPTISEFNKRNSPKKATVLMLLIRNKIKTLYTSFFTN